MKLGLVAIVFVFVIVILVLDGDRNVVFAPLREGKNYFFQPELGLGVILFSKLGSDLISSGFESIVVCKLILLE